MGSFSLKKLPSCKTTTNQKKGENEMERMEMIMSVIFTITIVIFYSSMKEKQNVDNILIVFISVLMALLTLSMLNFLNDNLHLLMIMLVLIGFILIIDKVVTLLKK